MEFLMNGLDCAHCANTIETQVKTLPYVENATLNFATKKLTLSTKTTITSTTVYDDVVAIVHKVEPHVTVSTTSEPVTETEDGISLLKKVTFSLGLLCYGATFFIPNTTPYFVLLMFVGYFLIGGEVLYDALRNIRQGQIFNENFLMAIATVGALALGEYGEAIAVMALYEIGEYFQGRAVGKSRKLIQELMHLKPDTANLLSGDGQQTVIVSPSDVKVHDKILIRPGEKIPLDATVISGTSCIDMVSLTGESLPKEVQPGDSLLSGTVNLNSVLIAEVTKPFAESTVSKVLALVENASSRKSTTENFITVFARYYTPLVVCGALLLFLIPTLLDPLYWTEWLRRALVFLVISCPCALVISVPLSYFGGIGASSKKGILIKGSNYLEALQNTKTVVFDKTGTLTKGTFSVLDIQTATGFDKDQVLEYAAYCEYFSSHPIAVSIQKAYNKAIEPHRIESHENLSGLGIGAIIDGKAILLGNDRLMKERGIAYPDVKPYYTVVHVAVAGVYAGSLFLADEAKTDSLSAIQNLRALGVQSIVMLTGDNEAVAQNIANQLGIDRYYAHLLPQDKVAVLEEIMDDPQRKGAVAFVGDGINDAPVLARADVGLSMGSLGSDAAIEASDVVLMTDEPSKIATAIEIAKQTRTIVLQNIIFALSVKVLVLLFAVFGYANMWGAIFADVGVSLLAVLNSIRILKEVENHRE